MHQDIGDAIEAEKSTRRLRELFHTRGIPVPIAESLMRKYKNDYDLVAQEIFRLKEQDEGADHNNPAVLNVPVTNDETSAAQDEDDDDPALKGIVERLRNLPLTQENLKMFNLAKRNEIPREQRQFACLSCDRDWWREVPERKQVSRCRYCKHKFLPVPKDQEWGLAQYNCPNCNHSFRSIGQMGLPAPCYRCRSAILPIYVIPRQRDYRSSGNKKHDEMAKQTRWAKWPTSAALSCDFVNKRWNLHSCCAENCYNRQEPYVPGTYCIHPQTRKAHRLPKILLPSQSHEPTGSTVASCISQDSLMECDVEKIIREDLKSISESDD